MYGQLSYTYSDETLGTPTSCNNCHIMLPLTIQLLTDIRPVYICPLIEVVDTLNSSWSCALITIKLDVVSAARLVTKPISHSGIVTQQHTYTTDIVDLVVYWNCLQNTRKQSSKRFYKANAWQRGVVCI